MREAQRIFNEHFGVSRAVSQENSNLNHNNVDNNSLYVRDMCECFSKSTNIEVNLNSCCPQIMVKVMQNTFLQRIGVCTLKPI